MGLNRWGGGGYSRVVAKSGFTVCIIRLLSSCNSSTLILLLVVMLSI